MPINYHRLRQLRTAAFQFVSDRMNSIGVGVVKLHVDCGDRRRRGLWAQARLRVVQSSCCECTEGTTPLGTFESQPVALSRGLFVGLRVAARIRRRTCQGVGLVFVFGGVLFRAFAGCSAGVRVTLVGR